MFGHLGLGELILIFLVVLLLFGAKNIPEIAKGIGKGIQAFKRGLRESDDELKSPSEQTEKEVSNKSS